MTRIPHVLSHNYKVTIATEVDKAYNHLIQRFIERVQALWARASNEDRRLALCIPGYPGQEQGLILTFRAIEGTNTKVEADILLVH